MPTPFQVRDQDTPGIDLGEWDESGSIRIPGNLTVGGRMIGPTLNQTGAFSPTAFTGTAIVAAMTAARNYPGGGEVYLPPGRYEHTGFSITTSLRGSPLGKTILHGPLITLSVSDIRLKDIKFIGTESTVIISAHCSNVEWDGVETTHDVGVGITDHLAWNAYDVDNMKVKGCTFGIGGLQLSLCDNFVINRNFWDAQYLNTNEPCHISGQSSGIFSINTITNTSTDGVDCFSSGHQCVIVGNRFIGLQGASGLECKVSMSDDAGNTSAPGNLFANTIIADNVFYDFNSNTTSTRCGIFAAYVDNRAVPAFAVSETNNGIIISNNTLTNFNATDPGNGAVVSYQGIVFNGHNGLVQGNQIRNMRAWNAATMVGIISFGETGDLTASRKGVGNSFRNNTITGVEGTSGAGFRFGNMDYCSVEGNTVRGDEVTGVETKLGITITTGASLNACKITKNTFQCNVASSMGITSSSTTTTWTECEISGNMFRDCGVTIYKLLRCGFIGNSLNNAANLNGVTFGTTGVTCLDLRIEANHITMGGAQPGILLNNVDGFIATGNTFKSTTRAMFAFNATKNGVVTSNISRTQSVGTVPLVFDATVSGPDQATTYIDTFSNKLLT